MRNIVFVIAVHLKIFRNDKSFVLISAQTCAIRFCVLVGTGIASVSKKLAVNAFVVTYWPEILPETIG